MISAISPIFTGSFSRYRDILRTDPAGQVSIPGRGLADPRVLQELLSAFRPELQGADRRALASLWSGQYFVRLLPPVVASILLRDHRLPLALEDTALLLDERGVPAAFQLAHEGEQGTAVGDPHLRFHPLVAEHLAPLIAALSTACGLSARVFWSNAGHYLEWTLGELARNGHDPVLLADGHALLASRQCPDGRQNPLYKPVEYVMRTDAAGHVTPWRKRRLCCVRYLLPDTPLCSNCPRLERCTSGNGDQAQQLSIGQSEAGR